MCSHPRVIPPGADPCPMAIRLPPCVQPQSHHTTVGHFTWHDQRACHAEISIPLCGMPEGLTCHIADEAGCHEPRRDDCQIETLRDASGDKIGVPSFCGLIEGKRPVLDNTACGTTQPVSY